MGFNRKGDYLSFGLLLLLLYSFSGTGPLRGTSWAGGQPDPFPEIRGWKQEEKPQVFSPETLYEYIDGAADLYLKYGFQELKVAEYRKDKKASVTVEIYRHKTPNDAFGIYSQERLPKAEFLDIGAQGYIESMVLNFLSGVYYVKINSYNTGAEDREVLLSFGRSIAARLGGRKSLPATLSLFPRERKRENSEKFVSQDFLGYSFLHSAFTADYDLEGKKFQIFVVEGADREDCRKMLQQYLKQTGNLEKKAEEGSYRLKDPYHGDVDLFWKGRFIWGILNLDDPGLRARYLMEFEKY